MDIHETCVENDISISSQWIPRESNKEADSLSRMNDCDDWGIQTWVFMLLDKEWGSHTFDRFVTVSMTRHGDGTNQLLSDDQLNLSASMPLVPLHQNFELKLSHFLL
jgi:hypothetical protein